jgi:hypothetical protein
VAFFSQQQGGGSAATATESYLDGIDPDLRSALAMMPCILVRATTWEDDANTELAPRMGLPPLPVAYWPEPSSQDEREDQWFNLHWKTHTLLAWAGRRSNARVDNEITDTDWIAACHHGRALLHPVDAFHGITYHDLEALAAWLHGA